MIINLLHHNVFSSHMLIDLCYRLVEHIVVALYLFKA